MRRLALQILIVWVFSFCLASVLLNINANAFWETLGFSIVLTIAFFLVKPVLIFLILVMTIITVELFLFIRHFVNKKALY